ncbi:MAG: tRNA pseudouridine(55) synthase TruB [Acidimicrobiia bacterium]
MTEGFLIVDKASGMTSHDVVARVRRATGVRKVGHAGTLDPMATGVVVVAIGRVTRLIRFIQDLAKEYVATGVFGVATDSLDSDGAVLSRRPMPVGAEDIIDVIPRFSGTIEQVPPMVSALRVGGERLYEIARRGETVEREARRVTIHELELTDFAPGPYPEAGFRVVCSKGTYVRSLVDDMARALGGHAHLTSLRRMRVGSLGLDRSVPTDAVEAYADYLLTPTVALADLPAVNVDDAVLEGVVHGLRFATGPLAQLEPNVPTVVLGPGGSLVAVYSRSGSEARPEVVLS